MTGSFKVQLINMGTRAAAFQAKLRALHEYHVRLLHNVLPAPSGIDIANNIKYFSQTLLIERARMKDSKLNTSNTIPTKYFSTAVLKDVRTSPHDLIRDPTEDPTRMSAYPNLEYGNLYNALTMLIDVAPCIQYGQIVFGKALLQCLCCILPFLDKDLIDNLPYLVSSTISVLPQALYQDIVNALCYYVLPFTITRRSPDEQECQACQSVSSVIMMVLQYSSNPAHHCQLLECLMTLKHNVVKDILCVIAYGTAVSRTAAAKLLFYYWPAFDPNLFDRKVLLSKLSNDLVPFVCQREQCPNSGNAEASKVCYDHSISITYAPDCPPPLYLCIECANEIHREHPNLTFGDMLHPMQQVSMVCENKNCRSTEKSAFSICFSTECASYNGNHPIRYCAQCHTNRHNSRRGGDHVVHRSLPPAWQMDPEMQMHMIESVVSLLREAKPLNFEPGKDSSSSEAAKKNGGGGNGVGGGAGGMPDTITLDERQMLGRYGIWLLVGRCTPTPDIPVEVLGRILSMLFHWFHVTAYSYDAAGQIESTIEKLKAEHVCNWLKEICRIHYNVFISCLLPHPPEYARVGGHWETLASRTSHLKEGLQRLICLVVSSGEVVTSEIWDYVMPHWMEAITNDVAEKELQELKIVLSKILDPDMSPLGFDAKTMYNFVAIRFEKTTAKVQQQALHWLQILTKLEILIPLVQLFAMFGDGVRIMKYGVQHEIMREKEGKTGGGSGSGGGGGGASGGITGVGSTNINTGPKTPSRETKAEMANPPRRSSISPVVEDDSGNTSAISDDEAPTNRHTEFSTDAEHNLTCCILMLDILLKQMELQDIEQHMGIHTSVCENVSRLLKCMVTAARVGLSSHVCSLKVAECAYCEASIMWHQLSTKLVQFMAPLNPVRPPDIPIEDIIEDEKSSRKSPPESDKEKSRDRDVSLSMAPLPIPLGPLGGFAGPVPVVVPQPEPHSVGGVLVHMPHVCSSNENGHSVDSNEMRKVHATDEIMTATVETVSEQLDLASILPSDRAIARSITLSDADVGSANASVTRVSVVGENGGNGSTGICGDPDLLSDDEDEDEDGEDYWHTSVGRFKFNLDQLPQTLQYIHQLLTEIPAIKKPEILYYVLQCLNVNALHGDALSKAAREHRGFFIWCQENLLIKNLWELCNAEQSHICQVSVPLLLHCITLPLGSDVFWRVVQEAFHDTDWRVRFTAVERVTVITRFMDATPLRSEVGLQTALATAFCHLIASMDDINVYVAQRATLYIGTIHDNAIRSLLFCLESQFDLFIVDRPVVLQSVYQLHNSLSDRKVLTWEFFLNRFDTLFVEAQINLEKCGDISYLRDLRNSENGSEALSSKILKAREALSQSDTSGSMAKTLSASFGTKWPYKRTMSAPASMVPRQDSKFVLEKEKIYSRQISAPILKRKTSRFGLGQFLGSSGNHSTSTTSHSCTSTTTNPPLQSQASASSQPITHAPHARSGWGAAHHLMHSHSHPHAHSHTYAHAHAHHTHTHHPHPHSHTHSHPYHHQSAVNIPSLSISVTAGNGGGSSSHAIPTPTLILPSVDAAATNTIPSSAAAAASSSSASSYFLAQYPCPIHHPQPHSSTSIQTNTHFLFATTTSTTTGGATNYSSSSNIAPLATVASTLGSTHSQSHQYLVHVVGPHSPMPTLREADSHKSLPHTYNTLYVTATGSSSATPRHHSVATTPQQQQQHTTTHHHHHHHSGFLHSHFQKHTSSPNLLPPPPAAGHAHMPSTHTPIPSPKPQHSQATAFPIPYCTCDAASGSGIGGGGSASGGVIPPATGTASASGVPAAQDGHIHSLGGLNDENLIGLLSRITELEESDRETIHLLVFLLMQFMSRTDQAFPSEDKPVTKTQNIVLKHLFLLLGHNQIEKTFHTSPELLRASAVFNAFLANLPQVLDQNHLIGGLILPSVMQVILYAPNPNNIVAESYQNIVFNYSLWHLEQYPRRNWMFTILVVLYKYAYTQPPQSGFINSAIRIVMNSLRGHFHHCRRILTHTILDIQGGGGGGGTSRSRDVSQPSLGTDPDDKDQSPPASPMFLPSEGTSGASKGKGQNVAFTPKLQHAFRKYNDSSLDADETESELVAIPESDLSDSTLHGSSAPGSFDDTIHFEDMVPTKFDISKNRSHYDEIKNAKVPKAMITTKTGDTYTTKIKPTETGKSGMAGVLTAQARHSLQEAGVRMIVTPLMGAETAVISPPVDVHRAVTVRNKSIDCNASSTSKMFAAIATNHLKALGALQDPPPSKSASGGSSAAGQVASDNSNNSKSQSQSTNGNRSTNSSTESSDKRHQQETQTSNVAGQHQQSTTTKKPIGRHKTIIECNAATSSSSTITDDSRLTTSQKKNNAKFLKRSDKTYGSPDSPMSKMSVMPNPKDDVPDASSLPAPKNIAALEIPTPERLLPIGTQESVAALVDRVREGLNLPDISHLKQDSLDVSESTKDDVTPSSRTASPRRLIKQVALESPTNATGGIGAIGGGPPAGDHDPHTSILKSVTTDLKFNGASGGSAGISGGGGTTPTTAHPIHHTFHTAGRHEGNNNNNKRPRQKLTPFTVDTNAIPDIRSRYAGAWAPAPFQPMPEQRDDDDDGDDNDNDNGHASTSGGAGLHQQPNRPSTRRVGDYTVVERCTDCGAAIEEYTDEEIGLLIVILGTFIHREPAMAAPFLPEILTIAARICLTTTHAWQGELGPPLVCSAQAVALQFLRCVLHQLAPNGVFVQVFQTQMKMKIRHNTFRSMARALQDFQELNATTPIYMVCESLQSKKSLPIDQLPVIFRNIAEYLHCISPESCAGLAMWSQAMQAMESLLRQVIVSLSSLNHHEYLLDLIVSTLRLNSVPKTLLDPYSKILAYCVQNINLEYGVLYDLCTLNARSFSKDRDKMLLCRQVIFEFVQALKFKTNIPDHNLLMIIGFVLHDAGGTLPPGTIPGLPDTATPLTTHAGECLRQYINDVIDFLADFHTLSKIKNVKNGQTQIGLGEDTLGGVLKGGVAQYLALEMSRGNSRDNKTVARYLPWLYNAPSSLQQGPKEFTECVGHMRLLSWLLLGSLTHMALMQRRAELHATPVILTATIPIVAGGGTVSGAHFGAHATNPQQQQQQQAAAAAAAAMASIPHPVPQEASCHIADHIQVIFAGFAEQSKNSVSSMSSLFHAFTLCQLWTVYLEQIAHSSHNIEGNTMGILFEFWAKVTPCILQLVAHSKPATTKDAPTGGGPNDFGQNANSKLSEMVNLHFLSLLEALRETNSTVLGKLLPLWSPVLSSHTQLSDTLHVRLQNVRDYAPDYEEQQVHSSEVLLKWLKRLQFKMGQIELQASTATQFYSI